MYMSTAPRPTAVRSTMVVLFQVLEYCLVLYIAYFPVLQVPFAGYSEVRFKIHGQMDAVSHDFAKAVVSLCSLRAKRISYCESPLRQLSNEVSFDNNGQHFILHGPGYSKYA